MEAKREEKMDMQEIMEEYKKLATPGPPHKLLARMEGSWDAVIKTWMAPDESPKEFKGSCIQKMILDGRFLQQDFHGEMMESPFDGFGITGYDNGSGKYISTWIDTMGTAILFFEGTADADGKTITQKAHYDDPVQGPMDWRSVTKLVDDNTVLFEMFSTDTSGKEEKMMEITYTRK